MANSVTFIDYTPGERGEDDGPWTHVRFEQAGDSRRGPWTALDTQELDDQDTDPTDPQPRTLTTDEATSYPGWFRVVWIAGQGEQPTEPEYAGSAIRPNVQEIADKMPDRTTVDGGSEARTFNTETSPTSEEVERAIDDALDLIDPRVPDGASAEVERAARKAVVLHAAIQIESGNWGDDIEVNETRVALWERLLARYEQTLDDAAHGNEAGRARFGSVTVTSPTLSAQPAGWCSEEMIP